MSNIECLDASKLPEYVTFDPWIEGASPDPILKQIAQKFIFPLSARDLEDIKALENKFAQESGSAGLAAPQIGISKAAIIFELPDDPELKQKRQDITQTMEKQIWLNPSYEGIIEEGMREDLEACFSVVNTIGMVNRFRKIKYQAFDLNGNVISGLAEGFLARVIQHEVDHLNGILFIEVANPNTIKSMEQYLFEKSKP